MVGIILVINAWDVSVTRYGADILKWATDELKNVNIKLREIMTMYSTFHPNSEIDPLYMTIEKGVCELVSFEGCILGKNRNLRVLFKVFCQITDSR